MCCFKTYPLPLAAMSLLLPDTLLAELYSIRQVCATLFCILLSTLSTSRLLLMLESDSQYVPPPPFSWWCTKQKWNKQCYTY